MTIKAKRAKSLRKMTPEEAQTYQLGGIVDDSLPAEAVRDALAPVVDRVDMEAFEAFAAAEIGRYRSIVRSEANVPSVSEELAILNEACEAVAQVRLRLTNLPPMAGAYANEVCWKRHGEIYGAFARRLDADLKAAWMLLAGTERAMEPYKGKPGTKAKSLRDCLLRDVAHWLRLQDARIGKEKAAGVAAAVLRAVGIEAPDDPRKAREIVLKLETPGNSA